MRVSGASRRSCHDSLSFVNVPRRCLPARVSALCRSDVDIRLLGLNGSGRTAGHRARTPLVGSVRRPCRPASRHRAGGTRAPRRAAAALPPRRGRRLGRLGRRGARGRRSGLACWRTGNGFSDACLPFPTPSPCGRTRHCAERRCTRDARAAFRAAAWAFAGFARSCRLVAIASAASRAKRVATIGLVAISQRRSRAKRVATIGTSGDRERGAAGRSGSPPSGLVAIASAAQPGEAGRHHRD